MFKHQQIGSNNGEWSVRASLSSNALPCILHIININIVLLYFAESIFLKPLRYFIVEFFKVYNVIFRDVGNLFGPIYFSVAVHLPVATFQHDDRCKRCIADIYQLIAGRFLIARLPRKITIPYFYCIVGNV